MMIIEVKIRQCPNCASKRYRQKRNRLQRGSEISLSPLWWLGTLDAQPRYNLEEKDQVLKAYQERVSMRGIRRLFGVVPKTLLRWIKQALESLPALIQTLSPAQADEVLELDELWSFVLKKSNKRWVWLALCRRTRPVVAYYVGDHSCRQLSQRVPLAYKHATTYSDFWSA